MTTRCAADAGLKLRTDSLPRWLTDLGATEVYRAVRMAHILGDGDELILGVRLADGQELTCAAFIDHLTLSGVKDAFFVPSPITQVLEVAKASNSDPDTSFSDVQLADARVGLRRALDRTLPIYLLEDSDTWPSCSALVEWLARLIPAGESNFEWVHQDSPDPTDVIDSFLASAAGSAFRPSGYCDVLTSAAYAGTGDPSRWSAPRLRQLLDGELTVSDDVPVEVALDVPELLAAFVPFVHGESGIRQELTAEALAAIEEMAEEYRATVLAESDLGEVADDDDDAAT